MDRLWGQSLNGWYSSLSLCIAMYLLRSILVLQGGSRLRSPLLALVCASRVVYGSYALSGEGPLAYKIANMLMKQYMTRCSCHLLYPCMPQLTPAAPADRRCRRRSTQTQAAAAAAAAAAPAAAAAAAAAADVPVSRRLRRRWALAAAKGAA